jgi:hypothetical protein
MWLRPKGARGSSAKVRQAGRRLPAAAPCGPPAAQQPSSPATLHLCRQPPRRLEAGQGGRKESLCRQRHTPALCWAQRARLCPSSPVPPPTHPAPCTLPAPLPTNNYTLPRPPAPPPPGAPHRAVARGGRHVAGRLPAAGLHR